ncbi:MAG TPA: hypothetical protein VII75_00025 [Thermoanaerobaculia bacterium]
MSIEAQVHDQFKIFVGNVTGTDSGIGTIADKVARFTAENEVAPKSIGVEYLEAAQRLVVTLGYRTGGEHYRVSLKPVSLGKTGTWEEGGDFAELERRMGDAAQTVEKIICHELFVTTDGELVMVFMTLAA